MNDTWLVVNPLHSNSTIFFSQYHLPKINFFAYSIKDFLVNLCMFARFAHSLRFHCLQNYCIPDFFLPEGT